MRGTQGADLKASVKTEPLMMEREVEPRAKGVEKARRDREISRSSELAMASIGKARAEECGELDLAIPFR